MRKHSLDAALATLALACAGAGLGCDGGSGKGAGGSGGAPGAPYGSGNGGAVTVTGLPPGSTTIVPMFPGASTTGSPPLAPGCTPASAKECPTITGNCASSQNQKVDVKGHGSSCYYGTASTTTPDATLEYIHETVAGQDYYRFRLTFDPAFVDNTYGANAIGWGTTTITPPGGMGMMGMMPKPMKGGHTFNDLVGSDHAEMLLADAAGKQVMDVKIDYITADAARPCGFGNLGVTGGEGKVLIGDPSWVLAAASSIDRNLNGCGYCMNAACGTTGSCTVDSPDTDTSYTPNATTPGWDYRVQYEIWVSAAAFASAGFGAASITFVHASPSKASSNTVTVLPRDCPPHWDIPYTPPGNACPPGYVAEKDEFGHILCRKPGGGTDCPTGYTARPDEFGGTICVPPGGDVPIVP